MSRKDSTAMGVGAALAGAAVAAFVSMGTAHADVISTYPTDDDGFQILFGAPGTQGLVPGQIETNEVSDANLTASNAGEETSLTNDAVAFESATTGSGDHGLEQLIYALDSQAYVVQTTTGIDGYLTGASDAGGYLVPDDFLGYLGTELDAFLLTPLGLDPGLLGPLIDTILGSPSF
jgi:hypothetical protein